MAEREKRNPIHEIIGMIALLVVMILGSGYVGFFFGYITKGYEKSEYETIIEDVASAREYDYDLYNCENFSIDLINNLTEAGYEAYRMKGDRIGICDPETEACCHVWVKMCLQVEATEGIILDPDYYQQTYLLNHCE
jgi:hypothetical protein